MEKIDKKEPENARNLAKIGRNFEAKCLKFRKIFLATLAESLRSFTFAKPSFKETREGKNFKFSFHFLGRIAFSGSPRSFTLEKPTFEETRKGKTSIFWKSQEFHLSEADV